MITQKAPPIFLFYLDNTLSDTELKDLKELNAKAAPSKEDLARIEKLEAQYNNLRDSTPIPVPIVGDLIGMIPEGYKQSVMKSMDIVGSTPVLKGNLNTATVTLKSGSNDFINALVGLAAYLFNKQDQLHRVCFFSPEMVIIGGVLLNMAVSTKSDTTEKVIQLEIQKGDASLFSPKAKKSPTELYPIDANRVQ
ncbi:hypothetical protein LQM11_003079 [Vibrio parahaemolyticus]|nr:hypothetical protein [Vibrio parahaemolyticus]